MIWQMILSGFFMAAVLGFSLSLDMDGIGLLSNCAAVVIVLAGTLSAALMVYPWKNLLRTARLIAGSFRPPDAAATIQLIVRLAGNYRQGWWDARNLEKRLKEIPPGVLRTGVELIAYQCGKEEIKETLEQEAAIIRGRYVSAGMLLTNLSQVALSFGLLGTVVNFIHFYAASGPARDIGPQTAAAFLSLFYGILLAKLGLAPLAERLKEHMADETFRVALVRVGLNGIHDREHPRVIRFKLESCAAGRDLLPSFARDAGAAIPAPKDAGLDRGRVEPVLNS
ncbi:MAG TPA: MotA/TolQ/ExbB proton channel family protein [Thermodesulfobacteriota bacterium]|nr:MotA/TolQ/ExbB proton channel family protein [Thermodesulfobacteriota bacterium]